MNTEQRAQVDKALQAEPATPLSVWEEDFISSLKRNWYPLEKSISGGLNFHLQKIMSKFE